MASLQQLKKRLAGTRNIRQMTEAMELVSATKMRRAQEAAISSRPYAIAALEILADIQQALAQNPVADENGTAQMFLHPRTIPDGAREKIAIVLVAADKGLAGAFNSSVFRRLEKFTSGMSADFSYIAVGQRAVDYVRRRALPTEKDFTHYGDIFKSEEVEPLSELLVEGYREGKWDRVIVFSTHFYSAIRQEVVERQLLPVDFSRIRATVEELIPETGRFSQLRKDILESRPAKAPDFIIEPSPVAALEYLIPLLLKMQVYHLIIEANAAEHSARRMAMKNATDNASDLISDLTLLYNRTRQEAITREVIEISATTAAVKR